jgi:hypothetical protein
MVTAIPPTGKLKHGRKYSKEDGTVLLMMRVLTCVEVTEQIYQRIRDNLRVSMVKLHLK